MRYGEVLKVCAHELKRMPDGVGQAVRQGRGRAGAAQGRQALAGRQGQARRAGRRPRACVPRRAVGSLGEAPRRARIGGRVIRVSAEEGADRRAGSSGARLWSAAAPLARLYRLWLAAARPRSASLARSPRAPCLRVPGRAVLGDDRRRARDTRLAGAGASGPR